MKKYFIFAILIIFIFACNISNNSGSSNNSGNNENIDDDNGKFDVYAGDSFFAKRGTEVELIGSAIGYTGTGWTQIQGTPVTDLTTDDLTATFAIDSNTPNFEELIFRLSVTDGIDEETSDIVITSTIYTKVYRLGTFDTMKPGHKTEWKTDWTAGDADGDNSYDPGYWFTFDDTEATGHPNAPGNSWILPNPIDSEEKLEIPGFNNHGRCLKMEYSHATNSYPYTFVGFGIKFADNPDPDYKHPFDLTNTSGIAFRIKTNDPRELKASLVSDKYTSWGTYDKSFTTSINWQILEYEWTDFVFPPSSWNPGTYFPINEILERTAGIQFQTTSQNGGADPEMGTIYIDDVIIFEM